MRTYKTLEAVQFLEENFGSEMSMCTETLLRAIRTNKLAATGSPGRVGYKIREDDLIRYGESRLREINKRRKEFMPQSSQLEQELQESAVITAHQQPVEREIQEPSKFPDIYRRFLNGDLQKPDYVMAMYDEKTKWEARLKNYRQELARIEMERARLENEINDCQTAIEDFENGLRSTPLG